MFQLRRVLNRLWRRIRQLPDGIRLLLAPPAPQRPATEVDSVMATRARFWDAVREGRREAEARRARRDP